MERTGGEFGPCEGCPFEASESCRPESRPWRAFGPGEPLLLQGERARALIRVRTGRVVLTTVTVKGREVTAAHCGSGQVVNPELLAGHPARGNVEAVSAGSLCELDLASLRGALAGSDPRVRALLALLVRDLGGHVERRAACARSARARIADLLRAVAAELPERTPLPISRKHLALAAGVRRETLSRTLAELRAARVLEAGPELVVADVEALKRVAAEP